MAPRMEVVPVIRTGIVVGALAVLLLVPAPAEGGSPLRVSRRFGDAADPGVLVLSGDDASRITEVWFGDRSALSLSPLEGDAMAVAVPPGDAGSSVPILLQRADGSRARAGRFRYDGVFRGRRRTARFVDGRSCFDGRETASRRSATTRSTVRRRRDGEYLYTWEMRNAPGAAALVRWETLEPLGFTGGLSFFLAPGERVRFARISASPPVRVRGTVRADLGTGCDAGEDGIVTWDAPAFLPRDLVGAVEGPRAVQVGDEDGGGIRVAWLLDPAGPSDQCEVIVHAAGAGDALSGSSTLTVRFPAADGTAVLPFPADGVGTLSLRVLRDGVPGDAVVRGIVRVGGAVVSVR